MWTRRRPVAVDVEKWGECGRIGMAFTLLGILG